MSKVKPITPQEVTTRKTESLPSEVLAAFNELIVENWKGTCAVVRQKDAVVRISAKLFLENSSLVYEKGWLDVENSYRKAGWHVEYDKPGFNESYEATFIFTKGKAK